MNGINQCNLGWHMKINSKSESSNVKIKYLKTREYYYDDLAINEFSLYLII